MAQTTVKVKAGKPLVVKLGFEGVATYSAAVYETVDGASNQYRLVRTLEDAGESADARPDELHFEGPPPGKSHLFFLRANVSHPIPNQPVSVSADIVQEGKSLATAQENGTIGAGFVPLVVRATLIGMAP